VCTFNNPIYNWNQMPGSVAVNLHEGSRSEYLAQFLFSAFGTSIPVPRQEDSGIDFYCTMTERLGKLAWPRAYYTVQVKSTDSPWRFDSAESVRWLIEQPLPLYLCIVEKGKLRFRMYQTLARFHVWSLGISSLDHLELTPGAAGKGEYTQWDGGQRISLSAPILDITLPDLLDNEERVAEVRQALRYWLDLDRANLASFGTGALNFVMPQSYETNSVDWVHRTANRHFGKRFKNVTEAEWRSCYRSLHRSLLWLARTLMANGDPVGAALIAMFMRHSDSESLDFYDIAMELNRIAGVPTPTETSPEDLYAVINELIAGVRSRLTNTSEAQPPSADRA
jgi:hypothetical protein